MTYRDEKVLIGRTAEIEYLKLNIDSEVEIRGATYRFERQEFCDRYFSMIVPENITELPPELVEEKYPSTDLR